MAFKGKKESVRLLRLRDTFYFMVQISNIFLDISICVFPVKVCVVSVCMYFYDRDRGVLWDSIATRACLQLRLPYLAAAQLHGIFGMTEREVCGTERERGDYDTWSE